MRIIALCIILFLGGCATTDNSPQNQFQDGEVTLKADRSELSELREEVPQEIQKVNDEEALLLELTGELKEHPSRVRSKWSTLMRKKRESLRKERDKIRKDFSKNEKQERDKFLNDQKRLREEFKKKKSNREESKDFFSDQDLKRKDFFANQRDKRKEFEAENSSKTKDSDTYLRERDKEFQQRYREYSKRWQERESEKRRLKNEKAKTKYPNSSLNNNSNVDPESPYYKDFESMNNMNSTPLGAGSDSNESGN